MTLSENKGQVGYPLLKTAMKLSWYELFKKTKESIVRKWVWVERGIVKSPKSLENLLGVYIVDSCGDLAALFEDNAKNILPKMSAKCQCNSCDHSECMCPTIQKDVIVQTDVIIEGVTRTNKTVTRVLKNGDIIEEKYVWTPSYNGSGDFIEAVEVPSQITKCKIDVKPCGCPIDSEENASKLLKCGCLINNCIPALRTHYPALYNDFGYYKFDFETMQIHIYDSEGKKSRLTQVMAVFQSNGDDMLIPDYALPCALALLDWTRKMYSPSFDAGQRREAKKNFFSKKNDMLKYLNPLPYEWLVEVNDPRKKNRPYYGRPHSDFVEAEVIEVCTPTATAPAQVITNITYPTNTIAARYLKKVVDFEDGPVSETTTYQNNAFVGLGSNNDDKVEIEISKVEMYNWGSLPDFSLDKTTGIITLLNGFEWATGVTLKVDLTQ